MTSAHQRNDIRIFLKECCSANDHGLAVSLIVADSLGNENHNNINIIDVGRAKGGRLSRMTKTVFKIYLAALKAGGNVYHFHDPELLPVGIALRLKGKKVVYDVHEDLPRQILSKNWIRPFLRRMVSLIVETIENFCSRYFNAIAAATPYITLRFKKINPNSININNYPLLSEIHAPQYLENKSRTICYIGGITRIRGLIQVVHSLEYCDAKLVLAGSFSDKSLEMELRSCPAWNRVEYLGPVPRETVLKVINSSRVGIVTFLPEPNHVNSQPNKMFEYMSAGLPVVASNFPLWKEIIEGNKCGLCVDPNEPREIGKAIDFILNNEDKAKQMGINAVKAVKEKYTWSKEEQKLLKLYESII